MNTFQEWDIRILVAILVSITTLIVTLIYIIYNRRRLGELKKQIDQQQDLNNEYFKNYLEFVVEGKELELHAFRELLLYVKSLRENINKVMNITKPQSREIILHEINEIRQQLIESFERNKGYFIEEDYMNARKLKDDCVKLADWILDHPVKPENIDNLNSLQKNVSKYHAMLKTRSVLAANALAEMLRINVASKLSR